MEAAGAAAPQEVSMRFNVNGGNYPQFIRDLRAVLAEHDSPEMVAGHPVLARQLPGARPKRWIHIKLVGVQTDGMIETTTLAVRDDNVYLIGFQAQSGRWYELGFEGMSASIMKKGEPQPDPTFLGCDVDYNDLLQVPRGEGSNRKMRADMVTVELGRRPAIEAVGILSRYNQADGGVVDTDTRRALVRLILMFCEATRITPFFDTIRSNWGVGTSYIHRNKLLYTWEWANISGALLHWRGTEPTYNIWRPGGCSDHLAKLTSARKYIDLARQPINIYSAGEALDVIHVLLKTKRGGHSKDPQNSMGKTKGGGTRDDKVRPGTESSDTKQKQKEKGKEKENEQGAGVNDDEIKQQQQQQLATVIGFGQPLVQVFAVCADSFIIIDTISVFDGKRGQVIYRSNGALTRNYLSQSHPGMLDLALSGPYRAISADGSFAIQVDGYIGGITEVVSGDTLWDCNSDKAEYDKSLTHDITIGDSIVKVTYAVLSNAVETTVRVYLKLDVKYIPGATALVYGEIMAKNLLDNTVLLFRHNEDNTLAIKILSSHDGLSVIPLPLATSVIAAPLDLPLQLEVKLYAICHPGDFLSFDEVFPLIHQPTGKMERNGVEVQVISLDMTPVPGEPEHVLLHFDCHTDDYGKFMEEFRKMLAEHPNKAAIHGRPMLAEQRAGEPERLMEIELAVDTDKTTTLAIRSDNLCLVGFKGRNGRWYEFDREGMDMPMLPQSTFLGFECSYNSLLYWGAISLVELGVGRKYAMRAIRMLWKYEHQRDVDVDHETKMALVILMVMFCESARIVPICNTVINGWKHGSVITKRHVKYICNWSRMSGFLMGRMSSLDKSHLRNIGIVREEDAANVVHLVLNSGHLHVPVSASELVVRGRSMVEVLSVTAKFQLTGTITLIDRKGGRVIVLVYPRKKSYSYEVRRTQGDNIDNDPVFACILTRANEDISSNNGGIIVEVKPHGEDDSCRNDNRSMVASSIPYDQGQTDSAINNHTITMNEGEIEMTYVVLNNAVEYTVQVQLNPKGVDLAAGSTASVYGHIMALNNDYGINGIQLFWRRESDSDTKMDVLTSNGLINIPIPLARSILVANLGSSLVIRVKLHTACSGYDHTITIDEYFNFTVSGKQTRVIERSDMDAEVNITIS